MCMKRMSDKYDRWLLKLLFVRSLFGTVGVYFNAVSLGFILDGFADSTRRELVFMVLGITGFNAVLALISLMLNRVIDYKRFMVEQHYTKDKTAAFLKVDYARKETSEFQDLRQSIRFSDDNMGTFGAVIDNYERLYQSILTFGLGIGILFTLPAMLWNAMHESVWGFLAAVIGIVLLVWGSTHLVKYFQKLSTEKVPALYDELTGGNRLGMYLLEQIVLNYNMGKDIRIYDGEKPINTEFQKMIKGMGSVCKRIGLLTGMPSTVSAASSGITGAVIYIVLAIFVVMGYLTVGSVVVFANSMKQVLDTWADIFICRGEFKVLESRMESTRELFELAGMTESELAITEAVSEAGDETMKPWNPQVIAFENVSFQYPGSDNWVLQDVSFKIHRGEKLSIVGRNGAGKSTAIKILCGLYQPQRGRVLIDGVDLQKIPKEVYRKMLATVFQDFKLFSFSIAENLALGEVFDGEKAEKIFAELGLDKRLQSLPEGTDTYLYHDYENGIECSGGEAQKIALARCRYRDTAVMVLDEPTSALDPRTEMEIFEDMDKMAKGKTVVYISHRLSSCRLSDRIIVFDAGEVVQEGTHEELVKEEASVYQQLWNAQAQYYA